MGTARQLNQLGKGKVVVRANKKVEVLQVFNGM